MTLDQLLTSRGITTSALADLMIEAGSDDAERDSLLRTIRRWRSGTNQPDPRYREVLHGILGHALFAHIDDPYRPADATPLDTVALVSRIARTDVPPSTIADLAIAVEGLCSRYSTDPPRQLIAETNRWLVAVRSALTGYPTDGQARDLKAAAGWLALLSACLHNDIGDRTSAETLRRYTHSISTDIGHGEIEAWSFELLVWFNTTDGQAPAAIAAAQQAQQVAPRDATVLIQLAGQEAMAWARLRDFEQARRCLDRAEDHVSRIPFPSNPRNHFAIDAGKSAKAKMWTALDAGDLERAERAARYVIDEGLQPDGSHRMPMRHAEGLNALAAIAGRQGDVAGAVALANQALDIPRMSGPSLAGNVRRVLAVLPAGDERDELDARLRSITAPAAA